MDHSIIHFHKVKPNYPFCIPNNFRGNSYNAPGFIESLFNTIARNSSCPNYKTKSPPRSHNKFLLKHPQPPTNNPIVNLRPCVRYPAHGVQDYGFPKLFGTITSWSATEEEGIPLWKRVAATVTVTSPLRFSGAISPTCKTFHSFHPGGSFRRSSSLVLHLYLDVIGAMG